MIVTFYPDVSTYNYQCFFGNDVCMLVANDFSHCQIIKSSMYDSDANFIIEDVPVEVIRFAINSSLLTLH